MAHWIFIIMLVIAGVYIPTRNAAGTECMERPAGTAISTAQVTSISKMQAAVSLCVKKEELCKLRNDYLNNAIRSKRPIADLALDLKARTPTVIILGENHGELALNYYPKLFAEVKKALPNLDCIAVEQPPSEYAELFEYLNRTHPSEWTDKRPNKYEPNYSSFVGARQLGLKLIAIDSGRRRGFKNGRDAAMAEEIDRMILTKECRAIISINGALHLLGHGDGPDRKTLTQNIKEKGHPTYTILLIDPNQRKETIFDKNMKPAYSHILNYNITEWQEDQEDKDGNVNSRNVCSQASPIKPSGNWMFIPRSLTPIPSLPVLAERVIPMRLIGSWNEIDAAIIISNPSK
jgi:hypothetical protein